MKEELQVNTTDLSEDTYDAIQEAINKLSNASQDQFEEIKKEKWYKRVFDLVTFSKNKEIRVAEQISTLAQAQQIFVELLLRLVQNNAEISDLVLQSHQSIEKLLDNDVVLFQKVRQIEDKALGISKGTDLASLSIEDKSILSSCLYYLSGKTDIPSAEQQAFANRIFKYINVIAQIRTDQQLFTAIDEMDSTKAKLAVFQCCLEYLYLHDKSTEIPENFNDLIETFDFSNKRIKALENQIVETVKLRGVEGLTEKYGADGLDTISDTFFEEFDFEQDDNDMAYKNAESIEAIKSNGNFDPIKWSIRDISKDMISKGYITNEEDPNSERDTLFLTIISNQDGSKFVILGIFRTNYFTPYVNYFVGNLTDTNVLVENTNEHEKMTTISTTDVYSGTDLVIRFLNRDDGSYEILNLDGEVSPMIELTAEDTVAILKDLDDQYNDYSEKTKKMTEIIEQYKNSLLKNTHDHFYIAPNIPDEVFNKMINSFDDHLCTANFCAFYDYSLFNTANSGIVFTNFAIYYKNNSLSGLAYIPYSSIQSITIKKSFLNELLVLSCEGIPDIEISTNLDDTTLRILLLKLKEKSIEEWNIEK